MKDKNPLFILLFFLCITACKEEEFEYLQTNQILYRGEILIVSNIDTSLIWAIDIVSTGATDVDNGINNTATIVNTMNNSGSSFAARYCDGLNEGGFTDWYLPSINELDALYKQSYMVAGLYNTLNYWSSTEESANDAWGITFLNGLQGFGDKTDINRCRCIRKNI